MYELFSFHLANSHCVSVVNIAVCHGVSGIDLWKLIAYIVVYIIHAGAYRQVTLCLTTVCVTIC